MQLLSRFAIIKQIFSLGTPIALTSMISYLASAIGILMISHFGADEVAASALATSTVMTINAMVGTAIMGVSIRVSYYRGKKAEDSVLIGILKSGIALGVLFALCASIIVWFGPQWLHLFHKNAHLISLTVGYFHISALFLIVMAVGSAWMQFLSGMGKVVIGTWAALIRLPIAVLGMYIFVFGHFGMPELKLAGVILAQSISFIFALLVLVLYTAQQPFAKAFFAKGKQQTSSLFAEMKALFHLGWPIGIQYGGELAAITISVYMIGVFGADALAAQQIVSQYSMMIIMITLGISQATSILIAKVHGERNLLLGHRIMSMSVSLIVGAFCLFAFIAALFGHQILGLFYNHNMVRNVPLQTLAYHLLWVAVVLMFFDALRNLFAFGLRSIGFPQSPMFIGLACLWFISLPCAYLFGYRLFYGVISLQMGFGVGFVIASILLWLMWYRKVEHVIAISQGS